MVNQTHEYLSHQNADDGFPDSNKEHAKGKRDVRGIAVMNHSTNDEAVEDDGHRAGQKAVAAQAIGTDCGQQGRKGSKDDIREHGPAEDIAEKTADGDSGNGFRKENGKQGAQLRNPHLDFLEADRQKKQRQGGVDGSDDGAASDCFGGKVHTSSPCLEGLPGTDQVSRSVLINLYCHMTGPDADRRQIPQT